MKTTEIQVNEAKGVMKTGTRVRIKQLDYLKPCIQGKEGVIEEIVKTPAYGNLYHVRLDKPDPIACPVVEKSELEIVPSSESQATVALNADREYRVSVNVADQSEEPQVSRITADRDLFDRWWAKAEAFAMNRGLYAVGQYREQGNDWQTLVEFES